MWVSASGFLPDGRTIGLSLGFGDSSRTIENALILNDHVHKLTQFDFQYSSQGFKQPKKMSVTDARLDLEFVPLSEGVAKTNLLIIAGEVHQRCLGATFAPHKTACGAV